MILNDVCELIIDTEHKTAPNVDNGIPIIRTPNVCKGTLIPERDINFVDEPVFLAWPEGDPRKALIEQLIHDTHRPGKILVYNQTFEKRRLQELARDFPEYCDVLHVIISRLEDLMLPFRRKDWHTPSMGRGYSIKTVLPLMVPELSYHDLEIQDGGDASSRFAALYDTTDRQLIATTREAMLQYCHMDTLAMVRIVEELEMMV